MNIGKIMGNNLNVGVVYFKIFSLDGAEISEIKKEVLEYAKGKYGDNYLISALCWEQLLLEYKKLNEKEFEVNFFKGVVCALKKQGASISHSKRFGAIAFTKNCGEFVPVGIDIECVRPNINETLKEFLGAKGCNDEHFYTLWTKYESTFKALGEIPLNSELARGERYVKAFKGESFIKTINGEKFAISIYSNGQKTEEIL